MAKKKFLMTVTIHLLSVLIAFNLFAYDRTEKVAQASRIIEKSGITPLIVFEKVQKKYPNGIIYEYEMERSFGSLVHEVDLLDLDERRRYQITVDAQTGEILEEDMDSIFWFGRNDDLEAAQYLSQSGFHLSNALQVIELEKGAVIYRIKFEEKYGIHYFEIKTYGPHGKKEWLIDADHQSIIPGFKR